MNLYIYSDESGVLDKLHNDYFVFGGLVFTEKHQRDELSQRYSAAEKNILKSEGLSYNSEAKASVISNSSKRKLFRMLSSVEKFGIIINQKQLRDELFSSKKTKQRYLDWAYKYAVRLKLERMIANQIIKPDEVESLMFFVDEHLTATDGIYELRESIEQEMRFGIFNYQYNSYHPPLFSNLKRVNVEFRDSKSVTLIRAADIVANRLYHSVKSSDYSGIDPGNFNIVYHPSRPIICN